MQQGSLRHASWAFAVARRASLSIGFASALLSTAPRIARGQDRVELEPTPPAVAASPPAAEPPAPVADDSTSITFGALETVTVDVERAPFGSRDVIGSVTIVGRDQLRNESVSEPLDLLRRLPGLFTEQYNQGIISSDVGVRGFNSQGDVAPLKLLIDGIPSNIHEGVADLKPIFPLEIDSIEVVRGTADPRHGLYALAGSLHVNTSRGGNGQVFRGVAGSFDTFEAQASSAFENERVSQNLFGGFRYAGGYREHAEVQKYGVAGKWYYNLEERLRIGVIGRLFRMDANAPGYLTLAEAREDPRASALASATDGGIQSNRHGSVHVEWDASAELSGTLRGYQQRVRRQRWVRFTEPSDQQERVQVERQSGAIAQLSWEPGRVGPVAELSVTGGADVHYQDNFAARYQTDNNRNRVATTRGQDFDVLNYGAFLNAELKPRWWWGVSAGVRWDRFDGEFSDRLGGGSAIPMLDFGNVLLPKAAAFLVPLRGYRLYANYGRSAQLPIREGLYSAANVTWSKNDGWEVGLKVDPMPWWRARLAYFRQSASDEVRELFNSSSDFENVGQTLRQGLEAEALVSATPHADFWVSYTYQRAERENPGANLAALRGTELNHVPRYLLKTGVDARPWQGSWVASLWVLSQGDYSLSNGDNLGAISPERRLGAFTLLNVDVSYTSSGITFGGHVKNLLNTRWNASVWNDGTSTLVNPGDGVTLLASLETAL